MANILRYKILDERRTGQHRLFRVEWKAAEVLDGQSPVVTSPVRFAAPLAATDGQVLNALRAFGDQLEAALRQGIIADDAVADTPLVGAEG